MKFAITDVKELLAELKKVKHARMKDESRPNMAMTELRLDGDNLSITALDGFVLVQRRVTVEGMVDGKCIIHPEVLESAIAQAEGFAEFEIKEAYLHCDTDTGLYIIRRYEGEFINYDLLVPGKDGRFMVCVNPDYMIKALKNVRDKGIGNVRMYFDTEDNTKAILITAEEGTGIVLPIRVRGRDGSEVHARDE